MFPDGAFVFLAPGSDAHEETAMSTTSAPSHAPFPPPDPTHMVHSCQTWSFVLDVPGVGRGSDCSIARAFAYLDAINAGAALADTICAQSFGCTGGRLIRVDRIEVQECVHLDSKEDEVHLVAHMTYGCRG